MVRSTMYPYWSLLKLPWSIRPFGYSKNIHSKRIIPVLAVVLAFANSRCEYSDAQPTEQHPVSGESYRDSAKAARIVERQDSGRKSAPGTGSSMAPLYGDNVYFVIEPIDFDSLESGMLVAYDSINGHRIVHQILKKEGDYWTVKGLNNKFEDDDYVTRQNLIGIVYGAFHAAE